MTAQWWQDAQCAGDDPERYETAPDHAYSTCNDVRRMAEWIGHGAVCDGCPVIAECARDALDRRDAGVVRGGIPCPPNTVGAGNLAAARAALATVAETGDAAAARWWLVKNRITRAERTSGHPLFQGARS
ncbi:WhiB family transcriptional regulator [Corynebacterium variabile]|uniref:WhiB family transcriptional regulator n=1 Tax=Corynebacterium variabile TaxID=1727 RepID=UPI003CB9AF3B